MIIENLCIQVDGIPFSAIVGLGSKRVKTYTDLLSQPNWEVVPTSNVGLYSVVDNEVFEEVSQLKLSVSAFHSGEYCINIRERPNGEKDFVHWLSKLYFADKPDVLKLLDVQGRVIYHTNQCRGCNLKGNLQVLENAVIFRRMHMEARKSIAAYPVDDFVKTELDVLCGLWQHNVIEANQAEFSPYDIWWGNIVETYKLVQEQSLCYGKVGGIVFDDTFLDDDFCKLALNDIKAKILDIPLMH